MPSNKAKTSFSSTVVKNVNQQKSAQEYIKRGWPVTPIEFGGTKAVFDDWKTCCLDMNDIDRLFSDQPRNIGVLLGEASGGLVVVSILDKDVLPFAKHCLPNMGMKFGPPSKRSSRWVYQIRGEANFTSDIWIDNDECEVIELVAEGPLSFPGSVDSAGGLLTFDEDGLPGDLSNPQYTYEKSLFEDDLAFLRACVHELFFVSERFKRWESADRAWRERSIDVLRECGWLELEVAEIIDTAKRTLH